LVIFTEDVTIIL